MIELYPFSNYTVVVLGLGDAGITSARALQESGATVWAWDDDPAKRDAAKSFDIPLIDLADIDWREPVSMVIEPHIAHAVGGNAHSFVKAARDVNCEIICDVEMLARVQREAAYIGICGHNGRNVAADLIGYVLELCGRDVEATGSNNKNVLELHPMGMDGVYVLDMPTGKLDSTVSITFEVAVWVNFDSSAITKGGSKDDEIKAMSWIFHRQTKPKTAIVNIDDGIGLSVYEKLKNEGQQVLIPVSANSKASWGIGVEDDWLIDDRENTALKVINLSETVTFKDINNRSAAVAAYACGVSIGLQPHAVMACINSYSLDK